VSVGAGSAQPDRGSIAGRSGRSSGLSSAGDASTRWICAALVNRSGLPSPRKRGLGWGDAGHHRRVQRARRSAHRYPVGDADAALTDPGHHRRPRRDAHRPLRSNHASSSRFLVPMSESTWVSRSPPTCDLVSASGSGRNPNPRPQVGRPLASHAAGLCRRQVTGVRGDAEASASAS